MNDELHDVLDGGLPPDGLDAAGRSEAEAWGRMVEAFRVDAPTGTAPAWLEQRVMAEIESVPAPGFGSRALDWLLAPKTIRLSPLTGGLLAAALATALLLPRGATVEGPMGAGASGVRQASTSVGEAAPVVYVQFRLEAPGARSVALAGDFTGWEADHPLEDPDADGVWTARVPVEPGVHAYMFLIDGTEWATDPDANRYQDDGFGNRNAVLAVAASD